VRTHPNRLLTAAFAVIAGAIVFGAWTGFPIFADAWVLLSVRERGLPALIEDNADRPVFGWLMHGFVSVFGFDRPQSAILTLACWILFVWQIARLWRRIFPERAGLAWLPAMLALSPIVVRTQFKSLTTVFPCQLPVIVGLEALLAGLAGRLWLAAGLSALGAAISEYGVAIGIAGIVAALVLGRPRLSVSLVSGTVAGSLLFRLMADPAARPDTSASAALPELLGHPLRPFARLFGGLWYALFGAYGDAAGRVDLDTLSRSSLAAALAGLTVGTLAVIATTDREIAAERAPRATLACLLAVVAGILPVALAGRPASLAGGELDPLTSRFLLPVLPFAACLTAGMLPALANRRGLLAGTFLLAFLSGQAAWREAFEVRRAQRRMDALGASLRPLVRAAPGITLAVVPDEPWLTYPNVVTGRATVGWPASEASRVWIVPRHLALQAVGTRTNCRIPAELRMPRPRHWVDRTGPLDRVVWVPRLSDEPVELEPYCVARPD
jgi:hypothetical protein